MHSDTGFQEVEDFCPARLPHRIWCRSSVCSCGVMRASSRSSHSLWIGWCSLDRGSRRLAMRMRAEGAAEAEAEAGVELIPSPGAGHGPLGSAAMARPSALSARIQTRRGFLVDEGAGQGGTLCGGEMMNRQDR